MPSSVAAIHEIARVPHQALHVFDGSHRYCARTKDRFRSSRCFPELDEEVAREVLRADLAALFAAQADEGPFIAAHDDPGVRATDEGAAMTVVWTFAH